MQLEVLLSVMNLKKNKLNDMNISCPSIVINQCKKNNEETYKIFHIYSYNEVGLSNSRNRGLEKISKDICILCDDDVIYNENYENMIIQEFENNKKADIIIFNITSPNRKIRINKKNKRLHFYNILNFTSTRIAFRTNKIILKKIKFNPMFGAGAKYQNGEEAIFLNECLKHKLKIYASTKNIGIVYQNKSTWFNGYDKNFFFDKGAIFTAINKKIRHLLFFQFLLRHKSFLNKLSFFAAYKYMLQGSKEYLNDIRNSQRI